MSSPFVDFRDRNLCIYRYHIPLFMLKVKKLRIELLKEMQRTINDRRSENISNLRTRRLWRTYGREVNRWIKEMELPSNTGEQHV